MREESFKLSHNDEELPSKEIDNVEFFEESRGNIIGSSEYEEVKDKPNSEENPVNENLSDLEETNSDSNEKEQGNNTKTNPKQEEITDNKAPDYDILIGKTSGSEQYGILGESINGHKKIAIDLSETNTISLFGVQGGGKSSSPI